MTTHIMRSIIYGPIPPKHMLNTWLAAFWRRLHHFQLRIVIQKWIFTSSGIGWSSGIPDAAGHAPMACHHWSPRPLSSGFLPKLLWRLPSWNALGPHDQSFWLYQTPSKSWNYFWFETYGLCASWPRLQNSSSSFSSGLSSCNRGAWSKLSYPIWNAIADIHSCGFWPWTQ